jgi:hypothetical protein
MTRHATVAGLLVPLALSMALATQDSSAAPAGNGERVIRAIEGRSSQRDAIEGHAAKEIRSGEEQVAAQSKTRALTGLQSATLGDHWIYDADVVLYDDFDSDGYYRLISVRIDADTVFNSSFVYAVIYLSSDGEYFEHFYTTADFELTGATADDEYFVDVELVSGYPPGLYDALIEIYDADLGVYMDEFGPDQSDALTLLPLEDVSYDEPEVIVVVDEHGGGGATSLWFLAATVLIPLRRARARRRRTTSR